MLHWQLLREMFAGAVASLGTSKCSALQSLSMGRKLTKQISHLQQSALIQLTNTWCRFQMKKHKLEGVCQFYDAPEFEGVC